VPTPTPTAYGAELGEEANDSPATFDDLVIRLAQQAAEKSDTKASDWISVVHGCSAFVSPYVVEDHPGSVMFSFDGARVAVIGNLNKDMLIEIAEAVD